MDPTPPCTKTLSPADAGSLGDLVGELPDGAVLCLSEGVYKSQLMVEKSLTVRALGAGVVLEHKAAPVVMVTDSKATLVLEGLTLRRGSGGGMGEGGNVSISNAAKVTLRNCTLERGEADANGGGGLLARRGEVLLEHCKLTGNSGSRASALLADGSAKVTLRDCTVTGNVRGGDGPGAALAVSGSAVLIVERSTIKDNDGRAAIEVAPRGGQPTLSVASSVLDSPLPAGARDLGGNTIEKR